MPTIPYHSIRFWEYVGVIPHERPGINGGPSLLRNATHTLDKVVSIFVIRNNIPLLYPSAYDVVQCAGEIRFRFLWHAV
jgi:hypothetical protein